MTEEDTAAAPRRHTRRDLLRSVSIGVTALGAAAILSAGDDAKLKAPPPRREPISGLQSGESVVYSTHRPETVAAVLRGYLQAYPKERVRLIHLGANDALQRIVEERDDPIADVLIHRHATDLITMALEQKLRPYDTAQTRDIPPQYRDEWGRWFAVALRPQVIVYHKSVLRQANIAPPASALGLTERIWRANTLGSWTGTAVIGVPDPTEASPLAWLTSIVEALGETEGRAFIRTLFSQGLGVGGSPKDLVAGIAAETYAIGPVEAPEVLALLAEGETNIDFTYAEQDPKGTLPGVWMSPTVVTMVRDQPVSRQLMEYLLSAEAARIFVNEGHEFPARDGIAVPAAHRMPRGGLRKSAQPLGEIVALVPDVRESLRQFGL